MGMKRVTGECACVCEREEREREWIKVRKGGEGKTE